MSHPAIAAGNVAVVTGAALGIGQALCRRFAAEGMAVAMLDSDPGHLEEARAGLHGEAEAILCDVAETEALERARDRVVRRWGRAPSVLINNAVTRIGRGLDAPLDEWRRAIEVNVLGVVTGVRTFLPAMQAAVAPGLIVNVGSKQGITNPPGHPVYNMAKAAIRFYTESLEHELRQHPGRPITAHLLVPGWTTTGLNRHRPGAWRPDQVAEHMMAALARGSFYIICPDDEVSAADDRARIVWSAEDVAEDRPPLSRWHPDWREVFARREPR